MNLGIDIVERVAERDPLANLWQLGVTQPQSLLAVASAALQQRLDDMQAGKLADLAADQRALEGAIQVAVDDALSAALDPREHRVAESLREEDAAALNDVTRTRAEEQALEDENMAEAMRLADPVLGAALAELGATIDLFQVELRAREEQLAQLDGAATLDLLRNLSTTEDAEQARQTWKAMREALQQRAEASGQDAAAAFRAVSGAEQDVVVGLNTAGAGSMHALIDQLELSQQEIARLEARQAGAFDWQNEDALQFAEMEARAMALGTALAMAQLQHMRIEPVVEQRVIPAPDAPSSSARAPADPRRPHEYPDLRLPGAGEVWFADDGVAWRTLEGHTAVVTKVGDTVARAGTERSLPAGSEIGLSDQARAHLVGPILGVEAPYGIALAHRAINQILQLEAIENTIRGLHRNHGDAADFFLVAETQYQPSHADADTGLFSEDVHYELFAVPKEVVAGQSFKAFAEGHPGLRPDLLVKAFGQNVYWASIEVSGKPEQPRVRFEESVTGRART